MVNMLDALNAFPLVKELEKACRLPAAASFKVIAASKSILLGSANQL